ncbi:MAG TPA: uroporphyrinogen-III synthase [Acidimicrobiales bacterium]|nr:uroporphyrinogen-III synthase [Acidimicrobiales bacterium]
MTGPGVLAGFRVGITADRRWDEQAALFERRGASIVHAPTIRTRPLGDEVALRRVTEDLISRPPAVWIANTGLGVRSWLSMADSWGLGRPLEAALGRSRIYARGPKASGAVRTAGLDVHVQGRSERLREVVDCAMADAHAGDRIALQVDGSGNSDETERMRHLGMEVVLVPVYRWSPPADAAPARQLAESTIAGRVDAVTFTAAASLRNWIDMCEADGRADDLRRALTDGRTVVGCVGPVCADAAASSGLLSPHLVQPDSYRLGPLVRAVAERLAARRRPIQLGATTAVLSGTAVIIGDECLSLTDTEARLLEVLAARPTAVLTKDALLRAVWGPGAVDTHAVEVGIARLRKRLGRHGEAVRVVHRRGYTLRS